MYHPLLQPHLFTIYFEKFNFLFTLLYICSPVFCQEERKPLKGKIKSDAEDLEGIYVINKTADLSVATARGGYFTIDVQPKDTLIFSAVNFVGKELIVEQENIDSELFFVEMEVLVTQLKEVIIEDYRHINEESLGLVPKGQKQYTQAEKKLYTATNGVDGIFNAISGRKRAIKKGVEYESKRVLMAKINYIYTEEEIIEKFNIPPDYVNGFIFYIVEDKEFAAAVKDKNDSIAKFLMSGLAVKYLEIINEDEEDTTTEDEN